MPNPFKRFDGFTRNIIIVFAGNSLANFFNLLYQLLIAHKLSSLQFAAFNSLLSIFVVIAAPLGTLQVVITKYCAEYNAHRQFHKIGYFFSSFLKKCLFFSLCTLLIFWLLSGSIVNWLKIPSLGCGYILALLMAAAWLVPLFLGAVQGLELFSWLSSVSALAGILKLALAFLLILLGFNIAGALGALLAANLFTIIILFRPLRRFFALNAGKTDIDYNKIFIYLLPVAVSYFCWTAMVSFDMVLVKYFFSPEDSGIYSLAQMLGKIFLFLPGAISLVMFPRTSGLKAKQMDTKTVLMRSLFYVFMLSLAAVVFYNIFPGFVLKVLTGKAYPQSLLLGRLFSISMSFFSALFILVSYFLSINNFSFIKYLVFFTAAQFLAIIFGHASLLQVAVILCVISITGFITHFRLAWTHK